MCGLHFAWAARVRHVGETHISGERETCVWNICTPRHRQQWSQPIMWNTCNIWRVLTVPKHMDSLSPLMWNTRTPRHRPKWCQPLISHEWNEWLASFRWETWVWNTCMPRHYKNEASHSCETHAIYGESWLCQNTWTFSRHSCETHALRDTDQNEASHSQPASHMAA